MLETVVYVSASVLDEPDLEGIIAAARRNNAAIGVTGVLLFADGNFIQALEGPPEAISLTLARIRNDVRHRRILELYRTPIEARNFPDWSMGCRRSELVSAPADAFDLSRPELEKLNAAGRSEEIFTLLKSFYRAAYRYEAV